MLGNFIAILGFSFSRGIIVGLMTVAMVVERMIIVRWSVTFCTWVTKPGPHSNWVSQLMKFFCNMVGFPIVKHEAQCLALFCLLELQCLEVTKDEVAKRTVNPRTRGLGELRG